MDPWRGMYPRTLPNQVLNGSYGYYQQPHPNGIQPSWPDRWVDCYSQNATVTHCQDNWGRPVPRAEIYDRKNPSANRPHSSHGYNTKYGSYENTMKNKTSSDYYLRARQDERMRGAQSKRTGHWEMNYYGMLQSQTEFQPWSQGYEDSHCVWQQKCDVPDKLESCSSGEPSLLSQYRDSGMSSSSYELSQYLHSPSDTINSNSWYTRQEVDDIPKFTPLPSAPWKFSLPHVAVCFGARGQLVRVVPNFPTDGQPVLVEIHSLEVILNDTHEQEELRKFPGPVQREDLHKVDIMDFCQENVNRCLQSQGKGSQDESLLWKILWQMCQQNGCIAGSDVAEILLQDYKREIYQRKLPDVDFSSPGGEPFLMEDCTQVDLLTGETPSSAEISEKAVEKFTKLLFYGRRKEALDWAMKSQLWGHALFLSSKMDSRTYGWVMGRFTSTLAQNDPLLTLFQFMGRRIPQAATCYGDQKWGDWRPHLAVVLSNPTGDPEMNRRTVVTMGDNLVLKGLTEAGHCCYLTADIALSQHFEMPHHIVLLGANHRQTFQKFASSLSIQRTEILEYCQGLRKAKHCIPSFQVYKLLYAARLMDYGLTSLALHYCECIASAVLTQPGSTVLVSELIKLAERLRYSDPRIMDRPDMEQNLDPEWLSKLRDLLKQLQKDPLVRKPVYSKEENGDSVSENGNYEAKAGYCSQRSDQLPATPPEGPVLVFEGPHSPPLNITILRSTYRNDEQHVQVAILGLHFCIFHCLYTHTLYLQCLSTSRRIRTVSESSTVSMEEDDEEEQTEDRAAAKKPNEIKKGSSFGWFGWFHSKRSKETPALGLEPEKRPESNQQHSTQGEHLKSLSPNPGLYEESIPAPHPSLPPQIVYNDSRENPFFRQAGIKEIEEKHNNNSDLVLPEIQGHLEDKVDASDSSLCVSDYHSNQPVGTIPLYNPAQVILYDGLLKRPKC
ncbi:hypothetical protein GDO86_007786 [Hymenochirus boettgeri]|uniref:Protein transport protein sec16 n=1 Tax=Hymenochirus boettgeri TaxID=247094 RepID=A0A8T2IY07_9PIPI|nr:hypothetical protein GDO86_007786 [Hymenochirus boettgeri]